MLPLAATGACAELPVDESHASLSQACGVPDPEPVGPLFPAGEAWFGKTPEQWAAAWWQWALMIPRIGNPMLGGPCDQDQSGDVFFLAGNFGRTETRQCTIPAGKAIYFPIANKFCKDSPEASCDYVHTPEELDECSRISNESTMSLTIDGVPIENLADYRAQSPEFVVPAPADLSKHLGPGIGPIRANTCGVPEGTERLGRTDGYWVMLRPLSPGTHTIRFAASVGPAPNPFSLDVTYQLTIAEAP